MVVSVFGDSPAYGKVQEALFLLLTMSPLGATIRTLGSQGMAKAT